MNGNNENENEIETNLNSSTKHKALVSFHTLYEQKIFQPPWDRAHEHIGYSLRCHFAPQKTLLFCNKSKIISIHLIVKNELANLLIAQCFAK